jgi:carboxymethylenebutenolidase
MVGFSLGGHVALLAATRIPFDLVVCVYGGWLVDGGIPLAEPAPPSAEADRIAATGAHVLGIVGERDFLISAAEWRELDRRLEVAGVSRELVRMPAAGHAFLREDWPERYDARAAREAWQRILGALERYVSLPRRGAASRTEPPMTRRSGSPARRAGPARG